MRRLGQARVRSQECRLVGGRNAELVQCGRRTVADNVNLRAHRLEARARNMMLRMQHRKTPHVRRQIIIRW